jgi:hypothetical protein
LGYCSTKGVARGGGGGGSSGRARSPLPEIWQTYIQTREINSEKHSYLLEGIVLIIRKTPIVKNKKPLLLLINMK